MRSEGHVDVLIMGAGLAGIGVACHLKRNCPDKSFLLLESRASVGGTWDLFRYPGVRSDSDIFTLGYGFKPWRGAKAIADGASILEYIRETASENELMERTRFHHRVKDVRWSSEDAKWTVEAERTDTGERIRYTCNFLYGCTGYYRYDEGYTPQFEGADKYQGQVIHPQHWPQDLDYSGKRIVVIGSGATAVSLVPVLAERAAHVTMLQRSPTYILAAPGHDPVADLLRRWLPPEKAYAAIRWKNVRIGIAFYKLSRRLPGFIRSMIRRGVQQSLPKGYDVDTHFTPKYEPWDERLCFAYDGDLFTAIREGRASVVTDRIDAFTERGVRLVSGAELPADIVVTATGLNPMLLGGICVDVDGQQADLSQAVAYKGMMMSGIPNFAFAIGYSNLAWGLKVDLVGQYMCRVLKHMDEHGYRSFVPRAPDPSMETRPFIDLKSGYVLRANPSFLKQGSRAPWCMQQSYLVDVEWLRDGAIEDEGIEFRREAASHVVRERRAG